MDAERFDIQLLEYLSRRPDLSLIYHFALADQHQPEVSQLYQVAAGAHAAMLENAGGNVIVDEFFDQVHRFGVYARIALHEAVEPGQHHSLHHNGRHQAVAARTVAADEVILELEHVLLAHFILGHGAETGVDPVDQFIG